MFATIGHPLSCEMQRPGQRQYAFKFGAVAILLASLQEAPR